MATYFAVAETLPNIVGGAIVLIKSILFLLFSNKRSCSNKHLVVTKPPAFQVSTIDLLKNSITLFVRKGLLGFEG